MNAWFGWHLRKRILQDTSRLNGSLYTHHLEISIFLKLWISTCYPAIESLEAEQEAAKQCDTVGIGVGLYAGEDGGYGAAQRLYVNRGYIPDGKGITYNYKPAKPGVSYTLDDDLILWFIKKLR